MGIFHYNGLPESTGGGGGGGSTFVSLSDTPGSILPGQLLRGDSGGSFLEFFPASEIMAGIHYAWTNAAGRTGQTGMQAYQLGVQRDTGDVYRYNGTSWTVFFNLNDGVASGASPQEANSTSAVDITAASFVDIPQMTLTATGNGVHVVSFSSDVFRSAGPTTSSIEYVLAVNGIPEADSLREQNITGSRELIAVVSYITLTAGQVVTAMMRTIGSPTPTATVGNRVLLMSKF